MSEIKRVWSSKKTTWNDKEQVWLKDGELKKYDWEWRDVEGSIQVYEGSAFETLPWTAELDTYDSNTPEFIGTVEDGVEAAYVFKDWDGTVLASGKVKDWGTPTAPENPTREGYEFTWWNPAVWPITKSTEYVAQYEQVTVNCTVTIVSNDDTMWSVDIGEVVVPSWTVVEANDNILVIGETSITATAETGYVFSNWGTSALYFSPIDSDCTITAYFESDTPAPTLFDSSALYYNTGENDVIVLFADTEDATDRVDLEFGTDQQTLEATVTVTGYWIYWISDPTTDLQQAALISALSTPTWPNMRLAFIDLWVTWFSGEIGTIDNSLITALQSAWSNYETQSYWDAVVSIINTAAGNNESLITTNSVFPTSISQASPSSVTVVVNESNTVRFNYLPTNVSPAEALFMKVAISSSDDSIAQAEITGISYDGEAIITIYGVGEGTATISYFLDEEEPTTYTISVTVTAAEE